MKDTHVRYYHYTKDMSPKDQKKTDRDFGRSMSRKGEKVLKNMAKHKALEAKKK